MISSLINDARELLKEKESEVTWFKIFTLLENFNNKIKSKDEVDEFLPQLNELLVRSIQSDRSRLNGMALDVLKTCIRISMHSHNFDSYLGVILKTVGRSNKVFSNRGIDALVCLGPIVDIRTAVRHIQDNITSSNKTLRFGVYKLVTIKYLTDENVMQSYVDKGCKDPSLEIRNLCKSVLSKEKEPVKLPVEPKKVQINSFTPRKNFKVDNNMEEIKKLEKEVSKITKDHKVVKLIKPDFFEKLHRLKQNRQNIVEKQDDQLTPRRLEKYLNKYRFKSSSESHSPKSPILTRTSKIHFAQMALKHEPSRVENKKPDSSENILSKTSDSGLSKNYTKSNAHQVSIGVQSVPVENVEINAMSGKSVGNMKSDQILYSNLKKEDSFAFMDETILFRKEMDSSTTRNDSIIHQNVGSSTFNMDIQTDISQSIIEDYSIKSSNVNVKTVDVNECLDRCPSIESGSSGLKLQKDDDAEINQCISDLSKSLINISIEPTIVEPVIMECKIEDNINIEHDLISTDFHEEEGLKENDFSNINKNTTNNNYIEESNNIAYNEENTEINHGNYNINSSTVFKYDNQNTNIDIDANADVNQDDKKVNVEFKDLITDVENDNRNTNINIDDNADVYQDDKKVNVENENRNTNINIDANADIKNDNQNITIGLDDYNTDVKHDSQNITCIKDDLNTDIKPDEQNIASTTNNLTTNMDKLIDNNIDEVKEYDLISCEHEASETLCKLDTDCADNSVRDVNDIEKTNICDTEFNTNHRSLGRLSRKLHNEVHCDEFDNIFTDVKQDEKNVPANNFVLSDCTDLFNCSVNDNDSIISNYEIINNNFKEEKQNSSFFDLMDDNLLDSCVHSEFFNNRADAASELNNNEHNPEDSSYISFKGDKNTKSEEPRADGTLDLIEKFYGKNDILKPDANLAHKGTDLFEPHSDSGIVNDMDSNDNIFGGYEIPDHTIILSTVTDHGVPNVFNTNMSSKITIHKLFSDNIFSEDENDRSVFRTPNINQNKN